MNDEERKLWTKRIQDYRKSGLTAIKWCEKNKVSVHILRCKITKFNKEKKEKSKEAQWAAIVPNESDIDRGSAKPLKVFIGNSIIEVAHGFDSATFKAVVSILSNQC